MDEPVARRLRSRDGSRPAAAAGNGSRRAFGDASNRLRNQSKEIAEPAPKRTTRTSRLTALAAQSKSQASEAAKPRRGRSTSQSDKTEAAKPTRRTSSRLRASSTAANERKVVADKPSSKPKVGKKRSSKGFVDTRDQDEPTTSRTAKRAKTEPSKYKATKVKSIPIRRSPRSSRDSKSNLVLFKPAPVVQAPSRCMIPFGFGLSKDEDYDKEEDFTHGIAYYDAAERSDPLLCKDYITDMFQNMYEAETRTAPQPYMYEQSDINAKMRAILIDWLVEVHLKFRLNPNTLYLCVNIIDRYCMKVAVKRSKLQLVGVTALLVACKHEEIYPPEVRDCVYITDRAYNRQEVLDMEQSILRELGWKISVPTAYPFLHRFLTLLNASARVGHAAQYYLERSLQEHDMLSYRPSEVCCAAVILAFSNPDILLQDEDYDRVISPGVPKILLEYTGFCEDNLIDICEILAEYVSNECITASKRKLTAVKKKFESSKYDKVASEVELPSVIYTNRRNPFGL